MSPTHPGVTRARRAAVIAVVLGLLSGGGGSPAVAQDGKITKAVLGLGSTPAYEIVNPTTVFRPDTPKVFCVWRVEGARAGTPIRAVWIAEDSGGAAPPNYKVDESRHTLPGTASGAFTLSKPTAGWPVGRYRLEIWLGEKLAKTLRFTVKAP